MRKLFTGMLEIDPTFYINWDESINKSPHILRWGLFVYYPKRFEIQNASRRASAGNPYAEFSGHQLSDFLKHAVT